MISKDAAFYQEPHNDDLLLEKYAKDESQEAFASLVERYANLVFATCRRRLNSADRAEDASQAVFILLARNAHRLTASRTLAPWLYRMSVLVCRGVLHQEEKMKRAAKAWHDSVEALPVPDAELSLTLDAALAKLARRDRDAILLYYLQGETLADLAASMGTSPDAVRMRISRALKQLRSCLEGLGYAVAAEQLPAKLESVRVQVPGSLLPRLQIVNAAPDISRASIIAGATTRMIRISNLKIAMPSFATGAVLLTLTGYAATHRPVSIKAAPATPYHVISFAVQPAGADRDPGFVTHRTVEQWIEPSRQRLTNYPYWKPGEVPESDYLLDSSSGKLKISVRSTQGELVALTRDQAINGTNGGRWAQAPQLSPVDSDFTKIEHFWKSAVVTRLARTKVRVFGNIHAVDPVEVTVHGFFRMTGYLDAETGLLEKQETYSRDGKGWYLIGFDDFDYASLPNSAFDPDTLSKTSQFELAQAVEAKKGKA